MSDLQTEEYYESDSSDNEENHSKLLSSVSQLDSTQRVKPAQRKEATPKVSEYNLTEKIPSKKNLISLGELADVLGKNPKHRVITKNLKNITSKSKTLPKPLNKSLEEQIKRSIGFENIKEKLRRWDSVVTRNALKDQIKFPLSDNSVLVQKSDEFLNKFQSPTPLEEQIARVLNQENKEEKEDKEKEFTLTLEEMLQKRREMRYLRAKLSYREAKAKRQSQIKSKKYHRILKREKLREQLKEFELLQKTNPEAALKKLSELDKTRAQERASLRHRNTGQWAKNLSVRAKYDPESRKILAEQLKISRELTKQVPEIDDSDKEEPEELAIPNKIFNVTNKFQDNPWSISVSEEVSDFVSGYMKYWREQNKSQDPISKETEECEAPSIIKNEAVSQPPQSVEMQKAPPQTIEIQKAPKSIELQKPLQTAVKKPVKIKKKSKKLSTPKRTKSVSIYPGSGVWIVTSMTDESDVGIKKKRKIDDIDTMFEELDDQVMENARVKIDKIKYKIQNVKSMKKSPVKKHVEEEFDLSLKSRNIIERPDMDVGLLEGDDVNLETQSDGYEIDQIAVKAVNSIVKNATDIDPNNFIQVKPKRLISSSVDNTTNGENDLFENEKTQVMSIEEAFVHDDVIAEFKEMKEETEKSNQIEIETSLPGWGQWGGLGIVPKPRKNRRLIINAPPRKDKKMKNTIINENANPNLKNHMVKEVPHPFKSVEAFEANIRVPVGREWVPETAHWKLIEKQVETKLGTVIDPMDEDEIVRRKKNHKSLYRAKVKDQGKTV